MARSEVIGGMWPQDAVLLIEQEHPKIIREQIPANNFRCTFDQPVHGIYLGGKRRNFMQRGQLFYPPFGPLQKFGFHGRQRELLCSIQLQLMSLMLNLLEVPLANEIREYAQHGSKRDESQEAGPVDLNRGAQFCYQ